MIELRVSEHDPIILEAEEQDQASLAVLEAFVSGGDIPAYTGSYNVTPTQSQQTLETNGKKMVRDVKVAPIPSQYIIPEGTLEVTQNGQQSVREYENVNVNVPAPTGEKTINVTQNGTTTEDVANYATAKVVTNVPASAVDSGTKNINSNGTHDVVGYASAAVSVPNSYSQSDEGKVVSNGALVSQSSQTIDTNGTYDTTTKNEVVVDVQGGGGGGGTVIASGTWMGDATNNIQVAVGKKMANTNFVFIVWLDNGVTIDASDGAWRKPVRCGYAISKRWGHFDLSSDGTKKQLSDISFVADNQSGTANTRTPNYCLGTQMYSRTPTLDGQEGWSSVSQADIIRDSSGFSLRFGRGGGNQYHYMTTTYYWEVIYFGDDPTNEIVEIP